MKKILFTAFVFVLGLSSFGAVKKTPDLLKQKEKFSDIALFEAKSIYVNRNANIELLKQYQSNPSAYKSSELFPIAICYLTVRDLPRSKTALESMLKDNPKSIPIWRTLGSVNFLSGDLNESIKCYQKSVELGDEFSAIYCSSALTLAKRASEVKPFLPILQKFAKTHLEALNVLLTYSIEFPSKEIDKILEDVFANIEARRVIVSATPDSFRLVLRIYMAKPSIWTIDSLVIPARAAALFEQWKLALDTYQKVLEKFPNNPIALRGMGLVQYRLGDVSSAAKSIEKAYKMGDKDAAIDGVELFLLSKYRFIWDMFSDKIDVSKASLDVRAGLVQYAASQTDCADMFFTALKDSSSDVLFKDSKVRALIQQCLDKYGSDIRAKDIAKRMFKVSGQK